MEEVFFDKLYTSQNVRQSAIYNACILFCDCLKITKQITQKHTNTSTSIIQWLLSQNGTISYLKEKQKIITWYWADSFTFASVTV